MKLKYYIFILLISIFVLNITISNSSYAMVQTNQIVRNLPYDILRHIIQILGYTYIGKISEVCKNWHACFPILPFWITNYMINRGFNPHWDRILICNSHSPIMEDFRRRMGVHGGYKRTYYPWHYPYQAIIYQIRGIPLPPELNQLAQYTSEYWYIIYRLIQYSNLHYIILGSLGIVVFFIPWKYLYYNFFAYLGYTSAQLNLADMYTRGHEVTRNYTMAVHYYKLAADQGDLIAQEKVGSMYRYGLGVIKNYTTAAYYYKLAADQRHSHAQQKPASMYEDARGVIQNYTTAAYYHRIAADQRHSHAQQKPASMYEDGRGVIQNYTTAAYYHRIAADQRNSYVQDRLPSIEDGRIVIKNYTTAAYYHRIAADQGFPHTQKKVRSY